MSFTTIKIPKELEAQKTIDDLASHLLHKSSSSSSHGQNHSNNHGHGHNSTNSHGSNHNHGSSSVSTNTNNGGSASGNANNSIHGNNHHSHHGISNGSTSTSFGPSGITDVGEKYAAQVTADMTCRCPHLDAYFPKYLDLGSLGLFPLQEQLGPAFGYGVEGAAALGGEGGVLDPRNVKKAKRMTMSDLHMSSILPPTNTNSTSSSSSKSASASAKPQSQSQPQLPVKNHRIYNFGSEEKKTDLIMCGGADSYTPLFPGTFVDNVLKEREFDMHLCKQQQQDQDLMANGTIGEGTGVTDKGAISDGKEDSKVAPTAIATASTNATETTGITTTTSAAAAETNMNINRNMNGPNSNSSISDIPGNMNKSIPMENDILMEDPLLISMPHTPQDPTLSSTSAHTQVPTPGLVSVPTSTNAETYSSKTKHTDTPKEGKSSDDFQSQLDVEQRTIQMRKDLFSRPRDNAISPSGATSKNHSNSVFGDGGGGGSSGVATTAGSSSRTMATAETITSTTATSDAATKKQPSDKRARQPQMTAEEWHFLQKQREADIEAAKTRVEMWLETIQQNRLAYWKNQMQQQSGNVSTASGFGSSGKASTTGTTGTIDIRNCQQCVKRTRRNRKRRDKENLNASASICTPASTPKRISPTGDALMQCLDSSVVLCGSDHLLSQDRGKSINGGKRHMQQYFLLSNNNFAITCGERGDIFCMKCGDFVHCSIFEAEKIRVEIEAKLPWIAWSRRRRLGRGFTFWEEGEDFYVIPNAIGNKKIKSGRPHSSLSSSVQRSIVWKGFRASYPAEVSDEMIAAARRTLNRLNLFQGDLPSSSYLNWDKATCAFVKQQQARGKAFWTIPAPVGIYNAGNICYISSVIQCIFNLRPIQQFFLREVKHDNEACKILRSASAPHKHVSCLACEVDKMMMEYYGNTTGLDVLAILNGGLRSKSKSSISAYSESSRKNSFDSGSKKSVIPTVEKGLPMVVSDFLATAWQLKDMAALAGNDQHDSHEFMQVFLDIIDKDCKKFQRMISSARESSLLSDKTKIPGLRPEPPIPGSMTSFFQGNLRSVLMCDTCGFKRKHMEPFINISLSLPINKGNTKSSSSRKYSEPRDGSGTRRQTQKIDVKTCIDHFSDPEPLADAVYCEWCKAKTKTKKQHTFAKLPTILCLHLKRFDAVTNKKIDEPVSFPSVLDMGPYLPHWREVEQTDVMTRDNERVATATKTIREKSASSPSILYDLCSTINHSGTLFQGHYMSNVKVDNDWYSCSDADVQRYSKESAEKDVLENGEAYMLFYMRKT